jgi:hypothetical protein
VVPVALNREVVTSVCQRLQHGLNVSNVEVRFGNGKPNLRRGRLGAAHPSVALEEDCGRDFAVQARFLDRFNRFIVQPDGV